MPVERAQRDWLFLPIMGVCALTISTLLAVLAVNVVRMRRRRRAESPPPLLPLHAPTLPSKSGGSGAGVPPPLVEEGGGVRSKHSSTSSWPDEAGGADAQQQLDIRSLKKFFDKCFLFSTGHVLLAFLQQHLDKPAEMIGREWDSVKGYQNAGGETSVARMEANAAKNVDPEVLPCKRFYTYFYRNFVFFFFVSLSLFPSSLSLPSDRKSVV